MDSSEDRKADFVILALSGKLDAATANPFEEKIIGMINSGTQRLVVGLCQQFRSPRLPSRRQKTSANKRKG